MRGQLLLILCTAACGRYWVESDVEVDDALDAGAYVPPDVGPYKCSPDAPAPAPAPPAACLVLETGSIAGATPFGRLYAELEYFGAGDCITISQAVISLRGACDELVWLQFSYPVTSDSTAKRRVETSFDATARFTLEPPGEARREQVTMIHVDVTQWQEGLDVHDIDIVVTVTDPLFSLSPLHVKGTFCDWPYYLC